MCRSGGRLLSSHPAPNLTPSATDESAFHLILIDPLDEPDLPKQASDVALLPKALHQSARVVFGEAQPTKAYDVALLPKSTASIGTICFWRSTRPPPGA